MCLGHGLQNWSSRPTKVETPKEVSNPEHEGSLEELNEMLRRAQLTSFFEALAQARWDNVQVVAQMNKEDREEIHFGRGHWIRLLSALFSSKADFQPVLCLFAKTFGKQVGRCLEGPSCKWFLNLLQ